MPRGAGGGRASRRGGRCPACAVQRAGPRGQDRTGPVPDATHGCFRNGAQVSFLPVTLALLQGPLAPGPAASCSPVARGSCFLSGPRSHFSLRTRGAVQTEAPPPVPSAPMAPAPRVDKCVPCCFSTGHTTGYRTSGHTHVCATRLYLPLGKHLPFKVKRLMSGVVTRLAAPHQDGLLMGKGDRR